jgi:hypothetical protein
MEAIMIDGAVKLTRVYERQSKSGKVYFVGFLGQSRLLIMRDDRAEVTGDTIAIWDVFIKNREEQGPRPQRQTASHHHYDHDGPIDTRPGYLRPSPPARPKPRPAQSSDTTAKNKGARDINQRLAHVGLNDEISDL